MSLGTTEGQELHFIPLRIFQALSQSLLGLGTIVSSPHSPKHEGPSDRWRSVWTQGLALTFGGPLIRYQHLGTSSISGTHTAAPALNLSSTESLLFFLQNWVVVIGSLIDAFVPVTFRLTDNSPPLRHFDIGLTM